MSQSTVKWLESKLDELLELYPSQQEAVNYLIEKAKQREKEQHYNTWLTAQMTYPGDDCVYIAETFEKYYNETFPE